MPVAPKVLLFLNGLLGMEQAKKLYLDDGTVNFYPVDEGYLQNYPGRLDVYDRTKGDPGSTDTYLAPPALSASYTRVASFVDFLGISHLVVVKGNKLYEKDSNGLKELATFRGYNVAGSYYPSMFVHQSKLVILNSDDTPMIWDGVDGVTPLGVHEVPAPPVNIASENPYTASMATNPYTAGNVWYNFRLGVIVCGPAKRDDGTTAIDGWYQTLIQLVDKYGNHGRASAPSSTFVNLHEITASPWQRTSFNCTWSNPLIDNHIHFVRQARTLTLNPDDAAPLGNISDYYTEAILEGTTCTRRTQRYTDSVLIGRYKIELDVGPPPSSGVGVSFGGRIWVLDSNGLLWYSDLLLFGQFRPTQVVRPYSRGTVLVPAGDRLFVIGHSSTEVYYEGENGPALLEQDISNGSSYGSTFVAIGDGAIFGLWNEGFGTYDGKTHNYLMAPDYIERGYVKTITETSTAKKINDWYIMPIKKGQQSGGNNILLMFSFKRTQWYIIEETVNDICYWEEEIIGVDNSIYVLFRGATFPAAKIHTAGLVLSELSSETTVVDVRLLMEPSSFNTVSLTVSGEQIRSAEVGSGYAYPMKTINMHEIDPEIYWDGGDYGTDWLAPGDVFLQMRHPKPVVGFYHRFKAEFVAGHLVRVKAIEISISAPTRPEQR